MSLLWDRSNWQGCSLEERKHFALDMVMARIARCRDDVAFWRRFEPGVPDHRVGVIMMHLREQREWEIVLDVLQRSPTGSGDSDPDQPQADPEGVAPG